MSFAGTIDVNTASAKREGIETFAELLAWARQSGILGRADTERLAGEAAERGADAEAVARRAWEMRDLLKRILLALAVNSRPDTADLDVLNTALSTALPSRRLISDPNGYRWGWRDRGDDDLDRMLWPVLVDIADILTSKAIRLVGQCVGEGCGLFFVDHSAGSPRKWCSQQACGHRARSHKHYHQTDKPRRERRIALAANERTQGLYVSSRQKKPSD